MPEGLELTKFVLNELHDHFADFNDDPDAPFGEHARIINSGTNSLTILHEREPYGILLTVQYYKVPPKKKESNG